ncbi:MAG: DNA polymerase beta superfamily protein [Verrucomicrobiales bacterium]
MRDTIVHALCALKAETGFRVLHACESGSRAWGFASRDSDWDVRFVFAWPRDAYLRIHPPPATLTRQLPGDLDLSGWALRMSLSQFAKSNASFLEWLGSPIVYFQEAQFMRGLEPLRGRFFYPRAAMAHYLGQARSLWLAAGEERRRMERNTSTYCGPQDELPVPLFCASR